MTDTSESLEFKLTAAIVVLLCTVAYFVMVSHEIDAKNKLKKKEKEEKERDTETKKEETAHPNDGIKIVEDYANEKLASIYTCPVNGGKACKFDACGFYHETDCKDFIKNGVCSSEGCTLVHSKGTSI
jgi:hypothetical protein